jgi:hypothetical protein
MLRHVALVRTDVSEESVNNVRSSLTLANMMMEELNTSETSVLTRATRHNILQDDSHHSHYREKLKYYIAFIG